MKKIVTLLALTLSMSVLANQDSTHLVECDRIFMFGDQKSAIQKEFEVPAYDSKKDNFYALAENKDYVAGYLRKSNNTVTFHLLSKEELDYRVMGAANYELKHNTNLSLSFTSESTSFVMSSCVIKEK